MNLTEYLKSTGEKPYKFAVRAGLSRRPIYDTLRAEKGRRPNRILLETALKIRAASDGLISLERLGVATPQTAPLPTRPPAAVP